MKPPGKPVCIVESGAWVSWWCPGCEEDHEVGIKPGSPHGWEFNGNPARPALQPSVLALSRRTFIDETLEGDALTARENVRQTPMCHSFIRDGFIQYLGDSTHELAGQTVPMRPIE
jgi:hypothetical protein